MNTVIYILCLLMIISLVFVFILFENVNKCVNLIRRFQKEHVTIMNKQKDIETKVEILMPYIKFIGDANELLLWKTRYNLSNIKDKMVTMEQYEQAEKVNSAIQHTDNLINYYRKNLMNPGNENNNN